MTIVEITLVMLLIYITGCFIASHFGLGIYRRNCIRRSICHDVTERWNQFIDTYVLPQEEVVFNTSVSYSGSIAIGSNATATCTGAIAIGSGAIAIGGGIAIGDNAIVIGGR